MSWGSTASSGGSFGFAEFSHAGSALKGFRSTSGRASMLPSELANDFTESMVQHLMETLEDDEEVTYKFHGPMHRALHLAAYCRPFQLFVLATVLLNIITISLETSAWLTKKYGPWFDLLDAVYLSIYTVEFLLKIGATPIAYWKNGFNLFDFFILLMSYVQFAIEELYAGPLSNVTYIRLFRAARAFRALRTVSFIPSLQTLVKAVLHTLFAVLNLAFLILLIDYVFAIAGYYIFESIDTGDETNHFTSLASAFVVIFCFITAESWHIIIEPLEDINSVPKLWLPRLFAVLIVFVGHFILSNLFIGVVLQNLDEATLEAKAKDYLKKQARFGKKKDRLKHQQRRQLKELMSVAQGAQVTVDDVIKKVVGHLRHEEIVPIAELSCDIEWFAAFLKSLEVEELAMYQIQQLQFELSEVLCEMGEQRLQQSITHYHQGF
ncbi:Cation Channel Sperm Associated 3 CatSper3 [Carpediemonas membranifera]|uniref:Cation Channel Sperm Associated 3 CatSper3 n=1 Tax=Carpediemonas membranifera TaxID=201153 RepID=A0A8J6BBU2_9EUKA|nr:Cation Channel Sperm Associated 3 CatSper3 [Carpediemonas membranifera]|eukprot:KAG9394122.1 Cation Channel Sperm Associated 3 CatSper3 [Carpediemonas membranifera]